MDLDRTLTAWRTTSMNTATAEEVQIIEPATAKAGKSRHTSGGASSQARDITVYSACAKDILVFLYISDSA